MNDLRNRLRNGCLAGLVLVLAGCAGGGINDPSVLDLRDPAQWLAKPMIDQVDGLSRSGAASLLHLDTPNLERNDAFVKCLARQKQVKDRATTLFGKLKTAWLKLKTAGAASLPLFGGQPLADVNWTELDDSLLLDKDARRSLFHPEGSTAGFRHHLSLLDYLKAYFGSPGGLLVKLETSNPDAWRGALAQALKLESDSPTVRALADTLKTQMDGNPNLSSLKFLHLPIPREDPGFVSRDGTRYRFPGLAWNGTSVSIDESQVSADVIRIVLEALRDDFAPLPFVANATRLKQRTAGAVEIYDPASPDWKVGADDFLRIQGAANQVESAVGGAVGKAIRGGSAGALNNEAIAKVVETAAAVFARHVAERVGWCACKAGIKLPLDAVGER